MNEIRPLTVRGQDMARWFGGGWLLAAGVLVLAAPVQLAWACVPQPRLVAVLPSSSGPPGTKVTVDGLGFDDGRVEIRWNSRDGDLLVTAEGPDFEVGVTIPPAPPGLYALVVLSRQAGGGVGNTARAAFQVTGSGDEAGSPAQATTSTATAASPSSRSSLSWPAATGLLVAGGGAGVAAATLIQRRRRGAADR